jgi:hypothetical protein
MLLGMTKEWLRYEPAFTETSQSAQAGQLTAAAAGTGSFRAVLYDVV